MAKLKGHGELCLRQVALGVATWAFCVSGFDLPLSPSGQRESDE